MKLHDIYINDLEDSIEFRIDEEGNWIYVVKIHGENQDAIFQTFKDAKAYVNEKRDGQRGYNKWFIFREY